MRNWGSRLVTKSKATGQESNPNPRQGVPPIPAGTQDHNFHTQAVFEIQREIGKLETGLKNVEDRLTRVESKLDCVATDINTLKTTIDNYRPLIKSLVVGIWGALGAVGIFGLTMLGYWLKHHLNW